MTLLQALFMGILQGLTEFLPISSSAHLIIAPFILNWKIPSQQAFIFDVLVQDGTLLAVIVFFWRDLYNIIRAFLKGLWNRKPFTDPLSRLGWYLILATIPAGIFGLTVKKAVENAFGNPLATGIFLLVTACLLLAAEFIGKRSRPYDQLNWKDAIFMGILQAIAIFPGISRSGATITGGMLRNLDRTASARFSFLMSVPIMLAAGSLATLDLLRIPNLSGELTTIIVGFCAAAMVGYLAIRWLLAYLARRPLHVFAGYCGVIGLVVISIALFRTHNLPQVTSPLQTPVALQVALSPEIRPLENTLQECAQKISGIALFINEITSLSLDVQKYDLTFRLSADPTLPPFVSQIGVENILVVLHPSNTIANLSLADLRSLFTGAISNWESLNGKQIPVSVWVYAPDNSISRIFKAAVMDDEATTSLAFLAPDPAILLKAVSDDPGAIGYLPSLWLTKAVRQVLIDDKSVTQALLQPLLAMAQSEPQGVSRAWLACVQGNFK